MWPFGRTNALQAELKLARFALEVERRAARAVHKDLHRQLRVANRRAEEAESALTITRHDSDRMIRHLTNMLLRAKEIGSYPVPDNQPDKPVLSQPVQSFEQLVDPGELEAVLAAAADAGMTRDAAIEFLKKEKGFV